MVQKITKWILCLGIGVYSAQCQTLESNARSQAQLKAPVNFRSRKQSDFLLYDNVFAKSFLKIGSRNPKWDRDAETALTLWSYELCDPNCVVGGPEFEPMISALRGALTNGCDDPLIVYMAVRMDQIKSTIHTSTPSLLHQNSHASYVQIMEGLKSHPYPAIEQMLIHTRAVQDTMSISAGDSVPALEQNRSNWLGRAIDLASEVDFNQTSPRQYRENIGRLCNILWIGGNPRTGGDTKKHYAQLEAALNKNKACSKSIFLTIKGSFYSEWAWNARGSGYADSVTEEGWKLFKERLRIAQQSFEAAWALDPSNEYICKEMVAVSGGQGDMDKLETWFQRGKKIDPDDDLLYTVKLNYLQPRWFGSNEEMLQFGRQCLKEGRWDARVPFLLLCAHYMLAGDSVAERREYFSQPEVWEEIQPLFKTYLARYPSDYMRRTSYANYAAWAGKWDLVTQLMHELGTNEVLSAWEDPTLSSRVMKIRYPSLINQSK
jgi:hypothetical protein